jgi:hypothetical protein
VTLSLLFLPFHGFYTLRLPTFLVVQHFLELYTPFSTLLVVRHIFSCMTCLPLSFLGLEVSSVISFIRGYRYCISTPAWNIVNIRDWSDLEG